MSSVTNASRQRKCVAFLPKRFALSQTNYRATILTASYSLKADGERSLKIIYNDLRSYQKFNKTNYNLILQFIKIQNV